MCGIRYIATLSLLLIVFVTVCDSIICFSCHSTDKPECGDDFRILTSDLDSRFDCPGSCYKRRGKRSSGGGEVRRVEVWRGCIARQEDRCFSEKANGLDQHTCVCNTNFCNTAAVPHVPKYLFFFCILLTLFSLNYH